MQAEKQKWHGALQKKRKNTEQVQESVICETGHPQMQRSQKAQPKVWTNGEV